jgi:phosphate starvation-inducible PhoH-like protein
MEEQVQAPLTRKERKKMRQRGEQVIPAQQKTMKLKRIQAITDAQQDVFNSYYDGQNLMLHGSAGTGKTYLSMFLALDEVLSGATPYRKVVLVRTAVPTRDIGFLKGSDQEKMRVYEAPYEAICSELFGRGDAYSILKQKNIVEFIPTSFIRGITLNDSIVISDECENANLHELDSIITRVGKNCKMIFSGDTTQSDFTRESEKQGLSKFMNIIKNMKSFDFVEFTEDDIVRSDVVREYIIIKNRMNINT